jgi:TatD DNase family protein
MTGAFDTHSHIQDPQLLGDLEGILERCERAGLAGVALCGYDARSNDLALELAARSPLLQPTVGFHPHEADEVTDRMLTDLEALASAPEVVAIGEIGLDFYRNLSSHENQRRLLDRQLDIALRLGKPVCIHSRSAEAAAIEQLGPFAEAACRAGMGIPGVMHCFGGNVEQAQPYMDAGFLISVACTVTYPKNEVLHRLVETLPLDVLVIETDSPYLPPQTMRGQLNEPAQVVRTAEAIATLRGETVQRVIDATTANACRLFRVPAREPVTTA